MQSTLNEPDTENFPRSNATEADWAQLAPLLDDALNELGETDRTALVLRFFENKTAREIATALRMEEGTAQKRVARALEKLRARFVKRGVALTATVIAGAVAANSVQAAPVGLAVSVTAAAAKGVAVGSSTLTLINGALKIMAWTKAKTAIAVGLAILITGTATTVVVKRGVTRSNSILEQRLSPKVADLGVVEVSDGGTNRIVLGDGRVFVVRSFILKDQKVRIDEKETILKGQKIALMISMEQTDSSGVTQLSPDQRILASPDQQVGISDGVTSVRITPHIKP